MPLGLTSINSTTIARPARAFFLARPGPHISRGDTAMAVATRRFSGTWQMRLLRDFIAGVGLPGRMVAFIALLILWALGLFFATIAFAC